MWLQKGRCNRWSIYRVAEQKYYCFRWVCNDGWGFDHETCTIYAAVSDRLCHLASDPTWCFPCQLVPTIKMQQLTRYEKSTRWRRILDDPVGVMMRLVLGGS